MKVLIIGLGSISKKHIAVLRELVPKVEIYALRSSKRSAPQESVINLYDYESIKKHNFHFVLISSPTSLHLEHLLEINEMKKAIMVEKPLFASRAQLDKFRRHDFSKTLIYVACNFRFHPLVLFIKEYIDKNPSKINEVNAYCGSYLPDWRPNVDYRKIYSSSSEMGGGVHLDLIHEPDYMVHLFGLPKSHQGFKRRVSNLEIDSVDSSIMFLEYDNFQAQIVLNYFRKDPKRTLEIVRENDTLLVDFIQHEITDLVTKKVLFKEEDSDILTSYANQMKYFLDCIEKNEVPINALEEAMNILELVL